MLDFGFILLLIGSIMLVWLKLGVKTATRALSPQPQTIRSSVVASIKHTRRRGYLESYILIAIGALLVIIAGVVN